MCRSVSEEREMNGKEQDGREDKQELPEYLQLHQMVVKKIGELCRRVNQVTGPTLQLISLLQRLW